MWPLRVAVARERRDAVEGAGLGRAVALGGGAAHAVGDGALAAGDRQRVAEGGGVGLVVGTRLRAASRPRAGETALRRERPEPSTAWMSVPTDFAKRSTSAAPASRVPREPSSAPSRLQQHLGEEVVGGHVRLLDQRRDRRRGDLGERVALERRVGEVGVADAAVDLHAALSQRVLQRHRGVQLRRARVAAVVVVAVVEREPRERAEIGPGRALAVEDRVVGEDPARRSRLMPLAAIAVARSATRVTGWSASRANSFVPKAGSPSPTSTRSPSITESVVAAELALDVGAGVELALRPERVEEGGGREQLLVRRRHAALVGLVAEERPVAAWRRGRRRRRRWRRRRRPSRRRARRAAPTARARASTPARRPGPRDRASCRRRRGWRRRRRAPPGRRRRGCSGSRERARRRRLEERRGRLRGP